jgi:hypothetical protein
VALLLTDSRTKPRTSARAAPTAPATAGWMFRICRTVRSADEASTRGHAKRYCVEDTRTSDESTNTRTTVDFGAREVA